MGSLALHFHSIGPRSVHAMSFDPCSINKQHHQQASRTTTERFARSNYNKATTSNATTTSNVYAARYVQGKCRNKYKAKECRNKYKAKECRNKYKQRARAARKSCNESSLRRAQSSFGLQEEKLLSPCALRAGAGSLRVRDEDDGLPALW